MNDLKTIEKIKAWAEKNYQKYFDAYQNGASASSIRTAERYEDIADICALASKAREEQDYDRHRRHTNCEAVIKKFDEMAELNPGRKYTEGEVREWMRRIKTCI